MATKPMTPSAVRRRILDDHTRLRGLLAELESLLDRFQDGHPEAGPLLRERGRTLQRFFLDHLSLEDAILVPALREADAWGEERARRVDEEHAAQRVEMEKLLLRLDDTERGDAELVHELREVAAWLRRDMEHEEAASLDERVLRDDVVTIGATSG